MNLDIHDDGLRESVCPDLCKEIKQENKEVFQLLSSMEQAEKEYPTPNPKPLLYDDLPLPTSGCFYEQPDLTKVREELPPFEADDALALAGLREPGEEDYWTSVEPERVCVAPLRSEAAFDWLKLAGLCGEETVFENYEPARMEVLRDKIIHKIQDKYPNLDVEWVRDFCFPKLQIAKTDTCINEFVLLNILESLEALVKEEEADQIVINLVFKKVKDLFG